MEDDEDETEREKNIYGKSFRLNTSWSKNRIENNERKSQRRNNDDNNTDSIFELVDR